MLRATKIIATIGPATNSADAIAALIDAGVDVFRLNFSHGTHESHGELIQRIREASANAGCCVAIMQDLSGPKIRTGLLRDHHTCCVTSGEQQTRRTSTPVNDDSGERSRRPPARGRRP